MTSTIPELEAWFDTQGLTWELTTVDVDRIDQVAGLTNQARHEPLDRDVVERYAADMVNGDQFPPVVLHDDDGTLVPVGGNHRIAATMHAGIGTLAAYVVKSVTAEVEWLLAIEDNRRHGLPLSDAERIHHALRLLDDGRTVPQAAAIVGVSENKLQRHVGAAKADRRAAELGVDMQTWSTLSLTTKTRLVAVHHPKLFVKIAGLAALGVIPAGEVGDVVSRVNTAETTADAMQFLHVLDRAADGRTLRSGGRPASAVRAPRKRLIGDLAGIMRFDPQAVAGDDSAPTARIAAQITAARAHLAEIQIALEGAS